MYINCAICYMFDIFPVYQIDSVWLVMEPYLTLL